MDLSHPGLRLAPSARDREARLLARLVRASRLTLLRGEAGAGKSTLLRDEVMPLLRRRDSDHDLGRSRVRRGPQARAERRGLGGENRGVAEIALLFDDWDAQEPLAALRAQVTAALGANSANLAASESLPETLSLWGRALGVRFLVVLDGFERVLAAPADKPGLCAFADAFVAMATSPAVPVHFLLAIDDGAEPLVEGFRARVPGFGDASVRLLSSRAVPVPTLVLTPTSATSSTSRLTSGPDSAAAGAIDLPDLEASIASIAASTGAEAAADPPRDLDREPEGAAEPTPRAAHVAPRPRRRGAAGAVTAKPSRAGGWIVAGAVAAIGLGAVLYFDRPPPAPAVTSTAAPAPTRADARSALASQPATLPATTFDPAAAGAEPRVTVDAALPAVELWMDGSSGSDPRIARDLARVLAAPGGLQVIPRPEGQIAASTEAATAPPAIALVLWDALGPAAKAHAGAGDPQRGLRVVMPLFTEEIHVLVRRDAPVTYVHELEGRRVNLGPAGSGAEITASRLWERMFGAPAAPEIAHRLEDGAALRKLLDDGSIDAMVVVAGQPARWLERLPPEIGQRLRLLPIDPQHPFSQRAIETYLPTVVRAGSYPGWVGANVPALASMSFLASFAEDDPSGARRVADLARALCRELPTLRRDGHPKWREVQPEFQPETGWPYSPTATAALRDCAGGAVASAQDASRRNPPRQGDAR